MSDVEETNQTSEEQQPKPSDVPARTDDAGQEAASSDTPEQTSEEPGKGDGVDWKAEARKWEARAKSNRDAEATVGKLTAELDELKKAKESADERVAQLESQAERASWEATVADETGLSRKALGFISADSLEGLREAAEEVSSSVTRGAYVPKIGDAPKQKRTTAEIFADHVGSKF